jgi:SAM-dependent methyltransferase
MGLGRGFLLDLIDLKRSGALNGTRRVAEIGAQQLADTLIEAPELAELCHLFGASDVLRLAPVGVQNFHCAPLAERLWAALGLQAQSLDLEGGIRFDLNLDQVPLALRHSFDLVVNAGTTEHVANQANAFRAIHDLTKVGGVMYHEVPAGGMVDHGLISYHPKFFVRLVAQNDYRVLSFRLEPSPPSAMPQYLTELNTRYGGPPLGACVEDFTLRVALRKLSTTDFSPPIDAAPHLLPTPRRSFVRRLKVAIWNRMRSFPPFKNL